MYCGTQGENLQTSAQQSGSGNRLSIPGRMTSEDHLKPHVPFKLRFHLRSPIVICFHLIAILRIRLAPESTLDMSHLLDARKGSLRQLDQPSVLLAVLDQIGEIGPSESHIRVQESGLARTYRVGSVPEIRDAEADRWGEGVAFRRGVGPTCQRSGTVSEHHRMQRTNPNR